MTYDEKLAKLSNEDFFTFFDFMHAEPRWVNSAGKQSIQLLGICHHGHNHSAIFDPTTQKVTCFSLCGCGSLLHNWVKRALDLDNPQDAKDFIEDYLDGKKINFEARETREVDAFEYKDRPYVYEHIEPLQGIGEATKHELYSKFDTSEETLSRLVWHTKDKIDVAQLQKFEVAYYPEHKTIILPHHNINGEIVGLYERSFLPLRKEIKKEFPEAEYKWLCQFPRAKYVPLLKEGRFAEEDQKKTSWSFSNILNLYGLHLAKEAIKESGKAIVFEGAKSVMLAHQYGYPFAVASHTFGVNEKQISMLIECGAKEIILAFDKQYETVDEDNRQWVLYEKKTKDLANKVKKYVDVSRIVDYFENEQKPLLGYKDAPIDNGKAIFERLYNAREFLTSNGEMRKGKKRSTQTERFKMELSKLKTPKVKRNDEILEYNILGEELITEI